MRKLLLIFAVALIVVGCGKKVETKYTSDYKLLEKTFIDGSKLFIKRKFVSVKSD